MIELPFHKSISVDSLGGEVTILIIVKKSVICRLLKMPCTKIIERIAIVNRVIYWFIFLSCLTAFIIQVKTSISRYVEKEATISIDVKK